MRDEDFLNHYGILGMKWGVRRDSSGGVKKAPKEKSAARLEKEATKEAKKRKRILASPTLTYKNRDKFTEEEIKKAMAKQKMDRELRSLSRDELKSGAEYAKTILAYSAVAGTVWKASAPTVLKVAKRVARALN